MLFSRGDDPLGADAIQMPRGRVFDVPGMQRGFEERNHLPNELRSKDARMWHLAAGTPSEEGAKALDEAMLAVEAVAGVVDSIEWATYDHPMTMHHPDFFPHLAQMLNELQKGPNYELTSYGVLKQLQIELPEDLTVELQEMRWFEDVVRGVEIGAAAALNGAAASKASGSKWKAAGSTTPMGTNPTELTDEEFLAVYPSRKADTWRMQLSRINKDWGLLEKAGAPPPTLTFPEDKRELFLIRFLIVIRDGSWAAGLGKKIWWMPWTAKNGQWVQAGCALENINRIIDSGMLRSVQRMGALHVWTAKQVKKLVSQLATWPQPPPMNDHAAAARTNRKQAVAPVKVRKEAEKGKQGGKRSWTASNTVPNSAGGGTSTAPQPSAKQLRGPHSETSVVNTLLESENAALKKQMEGMATEIRNYVRSDLSNEPCNCYPDIGGECVCGATFDPEHAEAQLRLTPYPARWQAHAVQDAVEKRDAFWQDKWISETGKLAQEKTELEAELSAEQQATVVATASLVEAQKLIKVFESVVVQLFLLSSNLAGVTTNLVGTWLRTAGARAAWVQKTFPELDAPEED